MKRAELAALVDHTLLRPEATRADVDAVAREAVELGCASVCLQPAMVEFAAEVVGNRIAVCSVVGFPHGATMSRLKASEAAAAVAVGAREIDMVIDLALVAEGDFATATADVAAVREAVPTVVLKVIIESALWTASQVRAVSEAAVAGGADFVKTSTGFHPAGGASVEAVTEMVGAVGGRARVKASGGIRTTAAALEMVDAGAQRLGLSATAAVLAGLT